METFGVSKDVIISCLGFRSEMANYLGSRPVDEYSEEFCSKVSNIYKAFGCSGIDIHANDFVCRTYRYKGAIQNNFMFPIYDGIRTSGKGKGVERVFNVMYPIWDTVRDSMDLSLLLKYREDNPIFDEILFVLIIIGAWKFGDFIKMCNDFFILTDRFYPV